MPERKFTFDIEAGNFSTAGAASSKIKQLLKSLGIGSSVMRNMAVAAYEAEMNLIIHSLGGVMEIEFLPGEIHLSTKDRGPGIPNVDLALTEGYSTAPESIRMMGFGAGMGLPNMKRCTDGFSIKSEVGVGTELIMLFKLT